MESGPVIIERLLDASSDRVWEAITNNTQMKKWYFDLAEFKPEVGFEFTFNGGPPGRVFVHLCRITEVIPGKKLKHSWKYKGYEGNSSVTFELFPAGNKTRIKLTHEGLETFPITEHNDFAKENFMQGWTDIIGRSLKEFVENQ
jgi:uncharacterized protein YndB with AHSA1/START domain